MSRDRELLIGRLEAAASIVGDARSFAVVDHVALASLLDQAAEAIRAGRESEEGWRPASEMEFSEWEDAIVSDGLAVVVAHWGNGQWRDEYGDVLSITPTHVQRLPAPPRAQ